MYEPQAIVKGSSYSSNLSLLYSPKKRRDINIFSDLEFYNWLFVEFNPRIKDYCEQPLTIKEPYEGKEVSSRFDMWILHDTGIHEFQEVKSSSCFIKGEKGYKNTLKQTTVQRNWCNNNDKLYTIRTEKELLTNLYIINNLKKIHAFVRLTNQISVDGMNRLLKYLQDGPKTLLDITTYLEYVPADAYALVSVLIYVGRCRADLFTHLLDYTTEVSIGCQDFVEPGR